jgi:hypothetical protein
MPHRILSIATLVLVSVLTQPKAFAADRCAARVNGKTGAVEVNASGVVGVPTWSGSTAVDGVAFANASACISGDRLRRCRLGVIGTLAEITPPSECRVCVHDGDDPPCCAFIRGCTPGPRLRDASFAAGDPRVCQGLGAADPACGPVGIWERTNGLMLLGYVGTVDLMVLEADGTAKLSTRIDSGIACGRALHAKGAANDLFLDSSVTGSGAAKLFQFRAPDPERLDLVDSSGNVISFARHAEVPSDLACGEVQVVARFSDLPDPVGGGLAFDGAALWYTDRDGHEVSVDPSSGAPGATLDLAGEIAAAAGQSFWMTHVDQSRREDVTLMARNGAVLDVVTTPVVAGDSPSVKGVAVDPQSDRVFLMTSAQDGTDPLFSVRTAGEPDTFSTLGDGGRDRSTIAFDGRDIWALTFRSNNLVRIDPQTGAAVQTFLLPGGLVRWNGIAAVNGDLFVVGVEFTAQFEEHGVLIRVRP